MKRLLILLIFFSFRAVGQSPQIDTWKGFKRTFVTIDKHTAYYVTPAKALPGNPWVWRASFPDWHTDMDSILLRRGFYVAYISIDNEYGSPYAMQEWSKFYTYLTDSVKLSARPALEGVSRGALYALGWAKRNPDKVSCIYSETPVYDFKSWPGGKGKGPGDTAEWKHLKQVYHLTEKQAIAYDDNPIDNLEGLAAYKVPVLNVIGISDQLAPNDDNTNIFVKRYTALGGPVAVYPVTEGPQELFGHHVPIKHTDKYAGFISAYTYPVKPILPYTNYFNSRYGIAGFYKKASINKEATVAFLGGSITYNPGWRQKVCKYLTERFPETHFKFIAAGIPSLGSLPHAFRLQRDVLDLGKIDLMFIEAAVNDRVNGTDSLTQVRDLEGIVRHAKKSNPAMDLIFMEFADPDKTADYNQGKTPIEVTNHELVARHYHLPSINIAKEVYDKLKNKEFSWDDDFKDIHPAAYGQELYFETIKSLLEANFNNADNIPTNKIVDLPKPLDKHNFSNGNYADINTATHDNNWILDPNWSPKDKTGTRDGFVNVPMLVTTHASAHLLYKFKGNAIGIAVISGPDAGTISYRVDNGPLRHTDLYTQWSSWLHLPWYVILGSGLTNNTHELKLTIDTAKNVNSKGNACRIVYFLVNH